LQPQELQGILVSTIDHIALQLAQPRELHANVRGVSHDYSERYH